MRFRTHDNFRGDILIVGNVNGTCVCEYKDVWPFRGTTSVRPLRNHLNYTPTECHFVTPSFFFLLSSYFHSGGFVVTFSCDSYVWVSLFFAHRAYIHQPLHALIDISSVDIDRLYELIFWSKTCKINSLMSGNLNCTNYVENFPTKSTLLKNLYTTLYS